MSSQQESHSSFSSSSSSSIVASGMARIYTLSYQAQQTTVVDVEVNGTVVDAYYDLSSDSVVFATSEGDVLSFVENETALIGNVGSDVASARFGKIMVENNLLQQEAVRVYVGSKPWTTDRWDSGVVETTNQSLPYGGGDNLVPGQKYWVHVAVRINGKWSAPQINPFVVPLE
jgi:hypothetical protein